MEPSICGTDSSSPVAPDVPPTNTPIPAGAPTVRAVDPRLPPRREPTERRSDATDSRHGFSPMVGHSESERLSASSTYSSAGERRKPRTVDANSVAATQRAIKSPNNLMPLLPGHDHRLIIASSEGRRKDHNRSR